MTFYTGCTKKTDTFGIQISRTSLQQFEREVVLSLRWVTRQKTKYAKFTTASIKFTVPTFTGRLVPKWSTVVLWSGIGKRHIDQ